MPTSRDKIEKWSLAYHMLKIYVDWGFRIYFKTSVSGLSNIPKDKTLIFAPNHQNALMDALAILSVKTWQPVFLARADIFEKPLVNKILTFMKILPIYRIRDGYGNLHKNDEIFNKTIDVLRNKNGLVILPEGNHGDKKRLRPLKKGIARIALQAEEASEGTLDIYIVPVGLDYSNYIKVGSHLHIRFGIPFGIKPIFKNYKENPAKAYNTLIKSLEKGMRSEMIDIEDERYYTSYQVILDTFTPEFISKMNLAKTHPSIVDAQIHIIDKINRFKSKYNDDFLLLVADTLELNLLVSRRNLDLRLLMTQTQKWSLLPQIAQMIVLSPLFLFSFLNNFLPLLIAKNVSKKFLDKQFVSSVRFALGLLLIPFFHIVQLLIFALISKSLIYTLAYTVSLPLSIYIFFSFKSWANILLTKAKELWLTLFKPKRLKRIHELTVDIRNQMWEIISLKEYADYMSPRI